MTTDLPANFPMLGDISEFPDALKPLSLETIDALISYADAQKAEAETAKKTLIAELARRYEPHINAAYLRESKDTGAVHIQDEGYDLLCERPKRVDWDQAALAKVGDEIAAEGDDPHEYLTVTYKVDERKYTAWPEFIRAKFAGARTVKPGAVTIKLAKLETV